MKKNTLLLAICFYILGISAQQRETVYISTKLPIKFRAYIDGELQFYGECSQLKILNIPKGEKRLSVRIMTPSNQQLGMAIAKSTEKEEYFKIEQVGETYVLKPNPDGAKENKSLFSRTSYIPKPKPAKKDTNDKSIQSCHVNDSALNKFIMDMSSLKDPKSRMNFTLNFMKRKCLHTHQIKSIGYRIDDDAQRFELFKVLFLPALDKNKFADLTSSFQSQAYGNKFMDWYNTQKF